MSKRYQRLNKSPGIYKDITSNRYQARKKIRGKQFSKTFDTVREARYWRITFNGVVLPEKKDRQFSTLGEVYQRWGELHHPSLEKSTIEAWKRRWAALKDLADYPMNEITSTVINRWIQKQKKWFTSDEYASLGRGHAGRCNLNNELNLFTTIFNWYRGEDEFEDEASGLTSPIRPRHKKMAFIKDTPKKADDKKIPVQDAFKFFSALSELYRDLAMTQFFCAGRIGEIAGIQIYNIDLERKTLLIKESASWCNQNKTFGNWSA